MRAAPLAVPAAHDMNPLRHNSPSPSINQQSCSYSLAWEINRAGYPAFPEGLLKQSLFTVKNVACSSSFNPISEHVGSDGSKMGYCKYTCASAAKARSEEASNYSWTDGPLPSIILVCRHTRKWPESNSKTTQSHPCVLCQFTSVCRWTAPSPFTSLATVWSVKF